MVRRLWTAVVSLGPIIVRTHAAGCGFRDAPVLLNAISRCVWPP